MGQGKRYRIVAGIVAVFEADMTADIGGVGMSRFHARHSTGGAINDADANTVGAAIAAMYTAVKAFYPSSVTVTVSPVYKLIDETSAGLVGELSMSAPPVPIAGGGVGQYAGGTGARIYWHTGTVKGRRFIRGATYCTPLNTNAYASGGGLAPSIVTAFVAAAGDYANAVTSGGLQPCIYSRPAKGETTGGVAGPITGWTVSAQPGSLRSRRS
jgi:hypothetical protein